MHVIRVGDVVAERFQLTRPLGSGAQGSLFVAIQHPLNREVAVKVVRQSARDEPAEELQRRFRHEAAALAKLAHPCCVQVFDYGVWREHPYVVMELIAGVQLSSTLRGEPWPFDRALHIAFQIARGLSHAHASGIVHRDLSPSNVMLLAEDEDQVGIRAKLVDFGLARLEGERPFSAGGRIVGTPAYMAPERIRGEPGAPPCDVYAVGVMLYEMLTGTHPLRRDSSSATVAAVVEHGMPSLDAFPGTRFPRILCELVDACTALRPGDRPADGSALRKRLAEVSDALKDPAEDSFQVEITNVPSDLSVELRPVVTQPRPHLADPLDEPLRPSTRGHLSHTMYALAGSITALALLALLLAVSKLTGMW